MMSTKINATNEAHKLNIWVKITLRMKRLNT